MNSLSSSKPPEWGVLRLAEVFGTLLEGTRARTNWPPRAAGWRCYLQRTAPV